jgi:hypothetical protein
MAVGRAERFDARKTGVTAVFGDDEETLRTVFATLALLEMAWHDNYGEVTPPEDVVTDVLHCSGGTISGLVRAAHLAVVDWRDLRVSADAIRREQSEQR